MALDSDEALILDPEESDANAAELVYFEALKQIRDHYTLLFESELQKFSDQTVTCALERKLYHKSISLRRPLDNGVESGQYSKEDVSSDYYFLQELQERTKSAFNLTEASKIQKEENDLITAANAYLLAKKMMYDRYTLLLKEELNQLSDWIKANPKHIAHDVVVKTNKYYDSMVKWYGDMFSNKSALDDSLKISIPQKVILKDLQVLNETLRNPDSNNLKKLRARSEKPVLGMSRDTTASISCRSMLLVGVLCMLSPFLVFTPIPELGIIVAGASMLLMAAVMAFEELVNKNTSPKNQGANTFGWRYQAAHNRMFQLGNKLAAQEKPSFRSDPSRQPLLSGA